MILETLPWELVAQIVDGSMPLVARLAALNHEYYDIFAPHLYLLERQTARFSDEWTSCLLWAAVHDRVETLQAAKRHGTDLNGPPADAVVIPSPHNDGSGTGNLMHLHLSYRDIEPVHTTEMPVKTPLYMAARHSSNNALRYLLESGVNVHQPYSQMTSRHGSANDRAVRYPLYTALYTVKDDFKAASLLLAHGAYAITPSSTLVEYGNRLRDRKLADTLRHFVKSFKAGKDGRPCLGAPGHEVPDKLAIIKLLYPPGTPFDNVIGPLQLAVLAQDANLVQLLLQEPEFGVPGLLPQHYARMVTPLALAVKRESDEIVDMLMASRLDQPPAKDILRWATERDDSKRLDQIVANIACTDMLCDPALLCNAVLKGNAALVSWLLAHDADPTVYCAEFTNSSVNLAVVNGKVDILKQLLDNTHTLRYISALHTPPETPTPLHRVSEWSVDADVQSMVDLLCKADMPIDSMPAGLASPLYHSLAHGNFATSCALLTHGARIDDHESSLSALHYCLMHHTPKHTVQAQAVEMLLARDCEVDRDHGPTVRPGAFLPYVTLPRVKKFGTPLFFAAGVARNPACVHALLRAGARLDSPVYISCEKYVPPRRRPAAALISAIIQTAWAHLKHDGDIDWDDMRAIFRSLLAAGARLDDVGEVQWGSGLDWACWLCVKTNFSQFLTMILAEARALNVAEEHVRKNIDYVGESPVVVDMLKAFLEREFTLV